MPRTRKTNHEVSLKRIIKLINEYQMNYGYQTKDHYCCSCVGVANDTFDAIRFILQEVLGDE